MMNAKEKFCEYFNRGATANRRIGLEMEHFIAKKGHILPYYGGVSNILAEISKGAREVFTENGNILGADMGEYTLTLEPGAQLEVSVCPFAEISKIESVLDCFYKNAADIVKEQGAELLHIPVVSEEELGSISLIPKKRYEYMDRYFENSGTMGRYMMRGSASVQVSVDYENEEDFVKKFRLAYIMSPFFALITSNGYLKRIEIWDNVDRERTSVPETLFDDDFGFLSYAEWLINVPAIFIPKDGEYIYTDNESIASLIEKYGLDDELLTHYLSMVFPDVRLKNYIEIRIGDAVAKDKALSYAAFIKAVFYTDMLDILTERYSGVDITDIKTAKSEILKWGRNARVYGFDAWDEISYLLSLAKEHLDVDERKYVSEVDYDEE